jgi:hypothetical protein
MKVYNQKYFNKYLGKPVRVKSGCNYYTTIAEGWLLATFNNLKEVRKYFPYGNYIKLK